MFEELWKSIQVHYAAKRYHLVLGNIQVLIPLFNQQLLCDRPALESTLNQLQDMLVQLDTLAAEFHFRDYLHRYFIQPLYQQIKLFAEPLAESFLQTLMKRIPRSDRGKIRYAKYEHTFQTFYNLEDKDPDKQLRLARGQRIALLEADIADNQYGVWSDVVLSYLDAQLCAGQHINAIQLRAVLNCLDALLTRINTANISEVMVEELWREVFIAQRLLLNSLAQASIGEDLSCEMLSNWWQVHQSQAAGLFLLPVIAQAIALHKEDNCDAWYALAQQINAQLMTYVPVNLTTVFANHLVELQTMRDVFKKLPPAFSLMTPQALVKAQQQFTQDTLSLLNQFVQNTAALLGDAPCDFALCALGSSSREDRRPYSDVELVLLYSPKPQVNAAHLQTYLYYLVHGVELAIKQCGESHKEHADPTLLQSAGFHLDDSSHLLKKKLIGTPEEITHKFIVNIAQSWEDQGHPWLNDESFYSLLSPVLINTNHYGGEQVLRDYKVLIQKYLSEVGSKADQIPTLVQSLNLTASLNFNGLKRREVIALSCLYDVAQKSKALLMALKPSEVVDDIKSAFYKPLTYLALNLKLFYDLNAKHPVEIFAEAASKLSWGASVIVSLLQTALSYITFIQVKLHLQHGHQEERIVWLGSVNEQNNNNQITKVSCLSVEEYAGLSLIKDSLLLPLCHWLEVQLTKSGALSLLDVLPYLLNSYLTKRDELWLRKWSQHSSHALKSNKLLTHPLISVLADYPSPDGWSPTYEQSMQRWLSQLQSLVHEAKSACLLEGIPKTQQKASYLPKEIVAQLFDSKGEFKGNVHDSKQSKVSQVTWHIPGQDKPTTFYFKVKAGNEAGLMGREFAVINLHQLLGGQSHIALGWPLKLTYFTAKGSKLYYCWVSEEVPGSSLSEVMDNAQRFELINTMLDQLSYSHLFITHYLTCPEDAQPDNFKVDPTNEGTFRLYGLDVGQSFVGTHDEKRKVLSVKTMLYLLEPAIHQALEESVLTKLMLLEPKALIKHWQANIKQMNQLFQPLFEAELAKTRVSKAQWYLHNQLIDISETVQWSVEKRLELLLNWLYIYPQQAKSAALLLKTLEPAVALSYQSLRGKIKTPQDFYNIDPKAYVKNPNTGKIYSSATYLQIQQQTLTPERLQASLNLDEDYFAAIDFRKIKDEQEQRYVLALLQAAIKNKSSFNYLNLSGCTIITEKELFELLQKTSNLKELYLEDCPQFNLSTIFQLFSFKVNEKLVGLRWEYEVLCPQLRKLSINLAAETHQLDISLSLIERKQLVTLAIEKQQQVELFRKKLVILLRHDDKITYVRLIKCLGLLAEMFTKLQAETVIKALIKYIKNYNISLQDDYNKSVQEAKMWSLGLLSSKLSAEQAETIVKMFMDQLEDENKDVREAIVKSLRLIAKRLSSVQAETLIKLLRDYLKDSNGSMQKAAVKSLIQMAPQSSVALTETTVKEVLDYLVNLNYRHIISLKSVIRLIAQLPMVQVERVVEGLLTRLEEDHNWLMRSAVVNILGLLAVQMTAIQAKIVVEAMLKQLSDKNSDVRELAAANLGLLVAKLTSVQANIVAEALLELLDDKNQNVQKLAVKSLTKLVAKLSVVQIQKIIEVVKQWPTTFAAIHNGRMQDSTTWILGQLKSQLTAIQLDYMVAILVLQLRDKDVSVRELAAKSLGVLADQMTAIQANTVAEVLLELLGDKERNVQYVAVESLVQMINWLSVAQNETVLKALLDMQRGNLDMQLAKNLVQFAGHVSAWQSHKVIEELLSWLQDENFYVRGSAVKCLPFVAQLLPVQSEKVIEVLVNQLNERETIVPTLAANSLIKMMAQMSSPQTKKVIKAFFEALRDSRIDDEFRIFNLLSKQSLPAQAKIIVTTLLEELRNSKIDEFRFISNLIDQCLMQMMAQLSIAEAETMVKVLLERFEDNSQQMREVLAKSLGQLVIQLLSVHQTESIVIKVLLDWLNDKDLNTRATVLDSLVKFFSPAVLLQWLQRSLLKTEEVSFNQLLENNLPTNQVILFKSFSFLDQKTLLQAVPQVNKEWHRWQKVYLQQQAEQRRTAYTLPEKMAEISPEEESEELTASSFKRFLL